jgi:hypothetical protein
MITDADNSLLNRVRTLFATILPMGTRITVEQLDDIDVTVNVAGTPLRVRFAGRGDFRGVQMALKARPRPDVIAASRLSVASRQAIAKEGINWADERGAASIEAGSMVIALSGQIPSVRRLSTDWTPAAIGVAEAILSGTTPTAEAVAAATGHSLSTAVRVLAFLVGRGLLEAPKARGPQSGRRIVDFDRLLDQYSEAAHLRRPKFELRCGLLWREPFTEIKQIGQKWTTARVPWSVAGALAASIQAPYLTQTPTGVVYVGASREVEMLQIARQAGLEVMEGGRLLLLPFPTQATKQLIQEKDGVWVTSWPRTYADLRNEGVRGEEAAEHLREVFRGN